MTSDVIVKVDGLPFAEQAVSGLTIFQGVNSIPYASVELDATYIADSTPDFLCNPELYKNRDFLITIRVESKTGCYSFEGYFDGLSISQGYGGIRYTAMIKSKWQRLVEIYPRLFGVMPGSFGIFSDAETLKCTYGDIRLPWSEFTINNLRSVQCDGSIAEFLVEVLKLMTLTQIDGSKVIKLNEETYHIFDLMKSSYIKNTELANVQLLNNIDVTYLKDCAIKSAPVADGIMKDIVAMHDNLWNLILSCFSSIGCCVVVGKDKMFVLPQAQFLSLDHEVPQHRSSDIQINIANPSQYTNFSTNDSGFTNLKASLIAVSSVKTGPNLSNAPLLATTHMGIYPENGDDPEIKDGGTGILITEAPEIFLSALRLGFSLGEETQRKMNNRTALMDAKAGSYQEILDRIKQESKAGIENLSELKVIMNQFAKLRFLQAKYGDRSGQLTTFFNPKWVPGSTGSLYTRLPGTFKQFYVTGVNHYISLHTPNNGTASTTVAFTSVRQGAPASNAPGIKEEEFYNYSTDKMKEFQQKWVTDVTT